MEYFKTNQIFRMDDPADDEIEEFDAEHAELLREISYDSQLGEY